MINAAYLAGEQGMWKPNEPRISPQTVAELLEAGELLVIERDGELAGCVRVRELDDATGELGLLSAAREGGGVGRELIAAAEDWARERDKTRMRLQLLVPKEGDHPFKARLDGWYRRLGYRPLHREDFPHPGLAIPCDLLNYEKAL
jgi:GNAT superfamily N-acetyltransferase